MRILVATNLYPPHHIGGYELRIKDIVDGLSKKGHDVYVLTSRYGIGRKKTINNIFRWLDVFIYEYMPLPKAGIIRQYFKARREIRMIKRLVKSLKIDLIYIAKVQGFHEAVIAQLACLGLPVVWDISDLWLTTYGEESWFKFWQRNPTHRIYYIPKLLIRKFVSLCVPTLIPEMQFENACYTSNFLKKYYGERGLPQNKAKVIHCGCPEQFFSYNRNRKMNNKFRFLYSGQLVEGKGVHTIIEAVNDLRNKNPDIDFSLDIIGDGIPSYFEYLKQRIKETEISNIITFHPKVPRENMSELYSKYDALIFPSIWDEALALTLLEAMAGGVPVISTATGGNSELLVHEENSLIFAPNDHPSLAKHMERIINDESIRNKISENGRETVRRAFTISGMVDAVEKYLHNIVITEHRADTVTQEISGFQTENPAC